LLQRGGHKKPALLFTSSFLGGAFMFNSLKGIKKPFEVIVLLFLPLFIFTSALFGGEAGRKVDYKKEDKSDFVLTVKENLISLNAKDASLKEIIEEIGRSMKIEVVANIPEEEKVTMEFEKLSIEDVIKRLSVNYVYLIDSEKGKITKIVFLPKSEGTVPTAKESEVKKVESLPKPESRVEEASREKLLPPTHEETEKEKPSKPEPFKFEFNP
jgi:hypothetical protein